VRFLKNIINTPSFRTLGVFAGGNLFVSVLGGLGGLIQARWIGPEVLGEFGKFGILPGYFMIGMVLVQDGLARQFPYLLGQGNKDAALRIAATAKWWYLLLCWLFSIIFAALLLRSLMIGDYRSAVGWGVQIPCIWTVIFGAYLGVMYRTSLDFKRLSYNSVIAKVIDFSSLIIVKLWGYWGLAARSVIASVVGLYLGRHYVPVKVKAVLDVKGLLDLARTSLPLTIPSYIRFSFLNATLSCIVLKYCGQNGLGIFGMALVFLGVSMTLTASIHQMFVTKLTHKFGETEDIAACLKCSIRPTLMSVGASTILAVALCLVIGPFIHLLLPKYEDAIPVIRILALQLPLSAAQLPFIIIRAALWYKSGFALALAQVGGCLTAVAILPITLPVIAASKVIGEFAVLVLGYGILRWHKAAKATPGLPFPEPLCNMPK
jgi:hypothetical protein